MNMAVKINKNVPLKDFTTYKIGGPARAYVKVSQAEELPEVFEGIRGIHQPYVVLGGGSNVIIADRGFPGTVIHMQTRGITQEDDRLVIEAGEPLAQVVAASVAAGLAGLEWASGIPGTLGGAVLGNAGAFYGNMAQAVKSVEVFDPITSEFKIYSGAECEFSYRSSRLKKTGEVIVRATLALTPGDPTELKRKADQIKEYRLGRHPQEPSVGSVFQNITDMKFIKPFIEGNPDAREHYKLRWKGKIPSAYLIEAAGLKGFRIGGAQIAHKHSAFIINTGRATAEQVAMMTGLIKERVWNKFGVYLREEVRYIGFN